ncbi:MAG: phage integrase N-terminal SAM-like domain-containing protein, partial [Gemmatimonadota bacterium]|nr:phage integrase N-terminal SAM-like domain-containing protein [Gemmatimonadota bacterium]
MRRQLRLGHYSLRTEQAYVGWVRRFVRFQGLRHPRELDERHVMQFLTALVEQRRVSASTQAQALAALLFLYREVLGRPLQMAGLVPKGRSVTRIPVVLDRGEVARVLAQLAGVYHLVGLLWY